MRRRIWAGLAALALLIAAMPAAASAAPGDPCEQAYTPPMNSTEKLRKYLDCRLDRLDKGLPAPAPTVTVTAPADPAPTVTVTAEPSPGPTVTVTATPEPSATPSETPTPEPTPTAPSETPNPTTSAPATLTGWGVTAATVGLAPLGLSCDTLPAYSGPDKPAAGAVIRGLRVTKPLDLSAGNILIERSCIQPTGVGQGMPILTTFDYNLVKAGPKVTIRDSEIDGSKLSQKAAAYATGFIGIADMTSNYVHHLGSGIALYHTGTTQSATIERNYVTDMLGYGNPATDGNHSDAFTIRDFDASLTPTRQAIIRNNRFDCDSPNATGALFIQPYAGRIDNTLIEGNLLEGYGWLLALEKHNNGYSNARAVNNRFFVQGFGAVYEDGGPGWAEWRDNYLYDAAAVDGRGRRI